MPSENSDTKSNLQSLIYVGGDNPSLKVLDQLLVPKEKTYIDVNNVKDAWTVIRTMQIRGAPLIAIVACLGLAVDLCSNKETKEKLNSMNNDNGNDVIELIQSKMEYLKTSRPTAVNLFNAMKELEDVIKSSQNKKKKTENNDTTTTSLAKDRIINAVLEHAEFMLKRDIQDNRNIGKCGADIIIETHQKKQGEEKCGDDKKYHIVTICNTGSLATAEYGTALGVVRALNEQKKLGSVTALETRPYNQGSRLTAFEIVEEQFPGGTLICDSAIGARMSSTKHSKIDACVVGADRVCANGDTANKIGTYNLALIAASHNVPFFVASPFTTLDCTLKDGSAIEIEERPAKELIESSNAPKTIQCWNPAFDVTPAKYITGIITEKGVITPDKDGKIDVAEFVEKNRK